MDSIASSMTNGSKSSGFPPATDVDTGVIPIRPSGRGMLQVAVDETRRSAALKAPIKARAEGLSFYYGNLKALKDLNMEIREKQVTALIGPSGCGKSTFLRCFNRMHDLTPGCRYEGRIMLQPEDMNLVAADIDPIEVRMRIGMVFQKPNPFPKSIYENVAYGLRIRGVRFAFRKKSRRHCGVRPCGMKSGTDCRIRHCRSRVVSSSVCASRGRWRRARKCCCSMSPLRRSIRLPRHASRNSLPRCASRSPC
jgi:hypothetical protein